MNVLVACECSGRVRDAFIQEGHMAISCDLEDTETPGPHYKGDVRELLNEPWDLMIAHPPCDHLAVSGARWFKEKRADGRQQAAIDFFLLLAGANIPRIAIENPVGIMSTHYRKPSQIIQPWQFGHGETKATCLWLKGLPALRSTNVVEDRKQRIHQLSALDGPGSSRNRKKNRSTTYLGIAEAMASQWGSIAISKAA